MSIGKVIATWNRKGGVGKSSCSLHLIWYLARLGKKVICIDLDSGEGLTKGIYPHIPPKDSDSAQLLLKSKTKFITIRPESIYLVPAHTSSIESLKAQGSSNILTEITPGFQKLINTLKAKCDYLIIDSSPNVEAPSIATIFVTDYFIYPCMPDVLSFNNLLKADEMIRKMKEHYKCSGKQEILGAVINAQKPNIAYSDTLRSMLTEKFGAGFVYPNAIGNYQGISDSHHNSRSIWEESGENSPAAQSVEIFCRETFARIERLEKTK